MKAYSDVSFDFSGKTAVITGASSGIFKVVACGYAEAGANVVIIDVNVDGAEKTRDDIVNAGGSASVYRCNVADGDDVTKVVAGIVADHGRIDVLVNGAGVQFRSNAEEFPEDKWDFVMDVNTKGTFLMCREVGRHMIEKGGGRIINVASMLSFTGGFNCPAYAASKGGVAQLTKALCNEWAAKNVNVNAIAPGYVLTEMNIPLAEDPVRNEQILSRLPFKQWSKPEDLVGAVLFLASQASYYMHGAIVPVDGGWLAR